MVYTRFKRRTQKVHIFEFDTNSLNQIAELILNATKRQHWIGGCYGENYSSKYTAILIVDQDI